MYPGPIDTPMVGDAPADPWRVNELAARVPSGRLATSKEIAMVSCH